MLKSNKNNSNILLMGMDKKKSYTTSGHEKKQSNHTCICGVILNSTMVRKILYAAGFYL
jgi:hypothetical protein